MARRPLYPQVKRFRDAPIDEEERLTRTQDTESFDTEEEDVDPIDLDAQYVSPPKAKVARIMTTDHVANPLDGQPNIGTEPDITTDPFLPGLKPRVPTRSFLYMLKLPDNSTAAPVVGGFGVTIWLRNSKTRQWGKTQSFVVDFNLWVTASGDYNGGELFFQFDPTMTLTDGAIEVHVLEQA